MVQRGPCPARRQPPRWPALRALRFSRRVEYSECASKRKPLATKWGSGAVAKAKQKSLEAIWSSSAARVGQSSGSAEAAYRVVDVETTGFSPTADRVVEVAWVDIAPSGEVVNRQDYLVNPGMPIPPAASAVHHITDDMVASAPAFAEVWPGAPEGLRLAAHNAEFDAAFLGLPKRMMICTMRLARKLWPDLEGYGNQFLRYRLRLNVQSERPHRALDDALVTAALLAKELQECSGEDVLELAWKPVPVRRWPFGKHKGLALEETPRDYVEWALRNLTDLGDDLRWSLEQILAGP
ncbi:MAG: 3'-5' exonuclease [Candidatus Schekmanbacteria bacterium]|nr:3'-5' exonuclease [Candidatus Schekmanbacteria bacterium]